MSHTPSLLIRKPKPETEKNFVCHLLLLFTPNIERSSRTIGEIPENHSGPFTGQISSWPSNQMHFKLSKQRGIRSNGFYQDSSPMSHRMQTSCNQSKMKKKSFYTYYRKSRENQVFKWKMRSSKILWSHENSFKFRD